MPEAPLPPTPAPVDNALSGGTWISGIGQTQVSGAVSATSAYAEITQWLTIDYTRNPDWTDRVPQPSVRNLSYFSGTEQVNVTSTRLHFNITGHTSCKKVFQAYGTSAFYQPQKFSVLANEFDKVGTSYGTVDGSGNAFVFGPQGSIQTIQPYINRVPWVDGIHTVYSLTQTGTTDGMREWPFSMPIPGQYAWLPSNIYRPYRDYEGVHEDIYDNVDEVFNGPGGRDLKRKSIRMAGNCFLMGGGGYNTSSEPGYGDNVAGIQNLISFIESNCSVLTNSGAQQRFIKLIPTASNGHGWIQAADWIATNPYYNTGFHDYT